MANRINTAYLGNMITNGDFPETFITGLGGKMGVFAGGTFDSGSIQLQISKDGAAPWYNFGTPITADEARVVDLPPCHVKAVLTGVITASVLDIYITRP